MRRTQALAFLMATLSVFSASQPPPPPHQGPPRNQAQTYSIEQAISDQAQLHTIAFDGLAFLTGTFGCDTFLPPGKVSDFFGFQYLRDIDPGGKGHNTDFLTRIAHNVITTLSEGQRAQLIALGREQAPQIVELARQRFPLIQAFRRQLEGKPPSGSQGLSRAAVMRVSGEMGALDGALAYRRAEVTGAILSSLNATQKTTLGRLTFGDSSTWPNLPEPFDRRSLPHDVHVAFMTYASELFSWYKGSVEADTYFCPERHGTYFGSFYLKDAPAMGQRDYTISTSLTGDSGEAFLTILNGPQRQLITGILEAQRKDLEEVVQIRRAIATELRRILKGENADRAKVIELSRRYGELDGGLSWLYATRFAEVNRTLSAEQKARLRQLRNLETVPAGAFLYSEPIPMPTPMNTDFLFGR